MKILYVTTVASTMNFFPAHIQMLQETGNEVELASNFEIPGKVLQSPMLDRHCKTHHIPFSRSPFSADNLQAYQELKKLLAENHYDIVHTHTPNASALVRLACRKLRKHGTKVFYTAHGFHFYTGAPLKNWLVYYPVERFLSRWTDVLITINQEDFHRAKTFCAAATAYVPGVGIDIDSFLPRDYIKGQRRAELGISEDAPMLLSVGELNQNKNHAAVLHALAKLCDPSIHYVICGQGSQKNGLEQLAIQLGIEKQVHLLGVRNDVAQWMQDADIYIFPSYREGLSVSLMEAMASGMSVICSDIRGNRDLIHNGQGGLLCKASDVDGYARALQQLLNDPDTREKMGNYNKAAVHGFSIQQVLKELKHIYGISEDVKEKCVSSM